MEIELPRHHILSIWAYLPHSWSRNAFEIGKTQLARHQLLPLLVKWDKSFSSRKMPKFSTISSTGSLSIAKPTWGQPNPFVNPFYVQSWQYSKIALSQSSFHLPPYLLVRCNLTLLLSKFSQLLRCSHLSLLFSLDSPLQLFPLAFPPPKHHSKA